MVRLDLTLVYCVSGIHMFLGLLSLCIGVISSIKAEVWLAHSVSPIWSGGFFIITGIVGILCARRKTSYVIMCFIAISAVSMVTTFVSFQLLRVGMVNHATDGSTFQKEEKDPLILIALGTAAVECLICILSIILSCRVARIAKEEMCQQREGMFHIKEETEVTSIENCGNKSLNENDLDISLCTGQDQNEQDDSSQAAVVQESDQQIKASSIQLVKNRSSNEEHDMRLDLDARKAKYICK